MKSKYKITTRRVCNNPEMYAAFVWSGKRPYCTGDCYETRAAAKAAAMDYVLERCLEDVREKRKVCEKAVNAELRRRRDSE